MIYISLSNDYGFIGFKTCLTLTFHFYYTFNTKDVVKFDESIDENFYGQFYDRKLNSPITLQSTRETIRVEAKLVYYILCFKIKIEPP